MIVFTAFQPDRDTIRILCIINKVFWNGSVLLEMTVSLMVQEITDTAVPLSLGSAYGRSIVFILESGVNRQESSLGITSPIL